MKFQVGDEITYKVTYLNMIEKPLYSWPVSPCRGTMLLSAKDPPVRYFFDLYSAVGAEYEWTDRFNCPVEEVSAFISDPSVLLFTLLKDGWTAGFFVLDGRSKNSWDLAYFGLMKEALGCGLGKYLLKMAVKTAWNLPGITTLTVNTNTLDHPSALPLYKEVGFRVINVTEESRILTRERTMPEI